MVNRPEDLSEPEGDRQTQPSGRDGSAEGKPAKGAANGAGKSARQAAEEDGPACQSCRKKKAKCSRTCPCSQCVRLNIDCIYDDRKTRPGLRTGAVENLNQRVIALEGMFLGQAVLWQQVWNCISALQGQSSPSNPAYPERGDDNLKESTDRLKSALAGLSSNNGVWIAPVSASLKRRRNSDSMDEREREAPSKTMRIEVDNSDDDLPEDLVNDLVEIYFGNIHPWIPILHVRQFRERLADPVHRKQLSTILSAIVSICARFSTDPRLASSDVRNRCSKKNRQMVILQSMESFSVENLQALIIIAFDTIGSGRGPSAWSIVGSMTRTVEQLQLSVEDESDEEQTDSPEFLIHRMAFLGAPKSWIEKEEQRRVFWNVFLMDRFCSIATGWNFSLTSADVKRRLPCEGALWEEGNPLRIPAPFFGVADKSPDGSLRSSRSELEDQTSIGGFAYVIEATESLSLVTKFFLQHAVNLSKMQDVQMWLMRFKELDLRLVQWKIFLPEKWREASVLNNDGILDPNLTLAHITHNTAVILLHQGIAYPAEQWKASPIRLPSLSSAETCLAAASEISIIAEKYLQGSFSLTNPQFAFCLFITGRMLLAHTLHYHTQLPPEFDSLVSSLREVSRRWNGPNIGDQAPIENLASRFARRLTQARDKGPHSLDIRQAAYSEDQIRASSGSRVPQYQGAVPLRHPTSATSQNFPANGTLRGGIGNSGLGNENIGASDIVAQEGSPDSISLAFPPLPLAFQQNCPNTQARSQALHEDSLRQEAAMYGQANFEHPMAPDCDQMNELHQIGAEGTGYDDLNSFFEYPFIPTQRISVFSRPPSVGRGP